MIPPLLLSIGLCVAMLGCSQLGYRVGLRQHAAIHSSAQVGVIEGAIFGLLGLLLGFTLQSSMLHLDEKRLLIVQEANAIGTAYLRVDLLDHSDQPEMRRLFRSYLEARLHVYDTVETGGDPQQAITQTLRWQQQIWTKAIESRHSESTQVSPGLVIRALNEMIDVTAARTFASRTKLPALIITLLFGAAIVSAMIIGYAMARQKHLSSVYALAFSFIISATIYTLLDLDNPRFGLIRLDAAEQTLRELHDSIP
jgi:hypothetical protein